MLNFTFHNPTVIYFGKGQIAALEEELKKRANKVLVVTGRGSVKKHGIFDEVLDQVKKAGVGYIEFSGVQPNPRVSSVREGIELCRKEDVDFILAVGGGSVIDAAKAIAAGVKYDGDVWDFFVTEAGPREALPVGSVLTVSATGSEMNPNSVITNEETRQKLALSAPVIRPVFSVLDPVYTFSVNAYHTAAGISDIMAHVFEYYLSPVPDTDVQDRLAEGLLKICVNYGPVACKDPDDYNARANIMWASTLALCGVVGRGRVTDWTCHAIEHEVSALTDVSHGAGLAILMPNFMKVVSGKYGPGKIAVYGRNVWGIEEAAGDETAAAEAIDKTRGFFDSLGLPSTLSEIGLSEKYFQNIKEGVLWDRGPVEHFPQLTPDDILKVLTFSL